MTDRFLTDRDVAQMFNISRPTVWRHTRNGLLPRPVKLGNCTRWVESELATVRDRLKAERSTEIAA